MTRLCGIHHVTAFAGDPIANLRFYIDVLGQRLVKRTVNFDDPTTYHLYFADRIGSPGSTMTFFPHPLARASQAGYGEVSRTIYSIPVGSADFWIARFDRLGIRHVVVDDGIGRTIRFADHDGMRLGLREGKTRVRTETWGISDIDEAYRIRAFDGIEIALRTPDATLRTLVEVMGLSVVDDGDEHRVRLAVDDDEPGRRVELVIDPTLARPRWGAGGVHHVAFRVADDEALDSMRDRVASAGLGVTEVIDRNYFHSIYFREPGGTLFEIATDVPGFGVDEAEAELGASLRLPGQYESMRDEIERGLIPITREMLAPGG
jgi:glyoxalase family protein